MSADQTDWTDSPPFDLSNSVEAYADGIARIIVVGPNVRMTLFLRSKGGLSVQSA